MRPFRSIEPVVNWPFVVEGSHHEPKGIHADTVVVKHEADGTKMERLGGQEVRKTAAKRVRTGAGHVADQGVVVRVQGNGASDNHVREEGRPREEHEKMRPEVDHVIVEYERVPEVVHERTSIESVSSSNKGLPEEGRDFVSAKNNQSLPFDCLSFKRTARDRLSFGSNIGHCTPNDVVSLLHASSDSSRRHQFVKA